MTDDKNNDQEIVSFSVLGENFNLRCPKNQKENLEKACSSLKEKSLNIMKKSPGLTPTQAAVLLALDSESALVKYLMTDTPFTRKASHKLAKITTMLKNTQND